MSFFNIKDPKKRDAVVADYLATVKRIRQRNLNEKAQDLARDEDLKELFNPVVQSTEKSTEAITRELAPLREEVKHLNENLIKREKLDDHVDDDDTMLTSSSSSTTDHNVVEHYLTTIRNNLLDKYFAVQRMDDGRYVMGDKEVMVDKESNIHVDGVVYKGTSGLWALVMLAKPKYAEYTGDDFSRYGDLVKQTNVMHHPQNVTARSRPSSTWKWKHILLPTHQSIKKEEEEYTDGDGIQFLPADIKGMTSKLYLLLAEFAAGNRSSTRNEIVFILDELLRRKKISRKEYTDINSYLSRCL